MKILKKKFSVNFPKILKDTSSVQRLDKLSIFEYFNLVEERKESKPNEYLIKEIIEFVHSNSFENEFKYALSDEIKKFKFILLNIGLLANRLDNIVIKREQYDIYNYYKIQLTKFTLLFYFKFLTLRYHCFEVLKFHIKYNQINSKYETNFILENEFVKKYNKIDFSSMKIKRRFIDDLNSFESDEKSTGKFKEKYIKNFILDKKDNSEREVDKLFLYIIAHVFILIILIEKLFSNLDHG